MNHQPKPAVASEGALTLTACSCGHAPTVCIAKFSQSSGPCRTLKVWAMMMLIIYAFGVLFFMLLSDLKDADIARGNFDGVLQSMNTLMLNVLCGPDAAFMRSSPFLNAP